MCCKKEKKYSIKRYFLPFVGVFFLGVLDEVRNFYYFPLIFTFSFFVLFWNFPFLVYYTNTQPTYYEDLFVKRKQPDYNVPYKVRDKFECIFSWTIIITSSLTMGLLADYWLYKTYHVASIFEILGITGGILKLFQFINNLIGKMLIKIIKFVLKNEVNKYNETIKETKENSSQLILEMQTIDSSNIRKVKSHNSALSKINS